jgi:undecaprenyl-diphosphatase
MNIFQALIVSAVEGITEFLPISSTGHLILIEHFLKIESTNFVKSFDIIIQFGAILAVVWLFWKKIIASKKLWKSLFISFLPTGILGFTLYKLIKEFLLSNVIVTVISLFVGGIALLYVDYLFKDKASKTTIDKLNNKKLINIGLFQSISMIPGVSRSAATIIGGMFSGLSRKDAVEYSFLLAIPTMAAASGYDLLKSGFSFSPNEIFLLSIGFITAFLTALLAVKSFTGYISNNNFKYFAIYRIILSIVVLLTFII